MLELNEATGALAGVNQACVRARAAVSIFAGRLSPECAVDPIVDIA
jgi:hypothetical protein